jgi:hypothetical protein
MSFLIDPPWLYATGDQIGRRFDTPADTALAATTMAVFWGVSIGLYLDRPFTRPVWRMCRARSGRDWMLNSGVFKFDPDAAGPGTHAVAAGLFALYPVALALGLRHGRHSR